MESETPKVLKWFEVTWVTASGRTLVRAEDEGEAKMLASQYAEESSRLSCSVPIAGDKAVLHQWTDPADEEPVIFDVDELAEDTSAELKREMEEG